MTVTTMRFSTALASSARGSAARGSAARGSAARGSAARRSWAGRCSATGASARVVVVLLAVVGLGACSSAAPAPTDPAIPPDVVQVVYPTAQFSARTLSDWKSLGDAVATVEITGSREDRSLATLPAADAGTYQRLVDVSVLHVFWQRDAAHQAPGRFTMSAWGWTQHGNERRPIVARGEPRLEIGHVYLLALARFPTGWAAIGDGAEVPFEDGVVGDGEWAGRDSTDAQPALAALMGKDPGQVAAAIDATQPDPRSVALGYLDPVTRARRLGKAG